jgi:fibronectin type 3 domain-containing protein
MRSTAYGGTFTTIASLSGTTYSNTKTVPTGFTAAVATGYFFEVVPVFTGGITGQASPVTGGMLVGGLTPSGLTVSATTASSISLNWAPVSTVTSYTIYQSLASAGPYTSVGTSNTTTATVGSLAGGTTYYFKVATTSCSTSCQSSFVSGATYAVPIAPAAIPGNSTVTVTWTAVGAPSYKILRSTDLATFSVIQSGVTGGSFSDNTAVNGTQYFYEVQATLASGNLTSAATSRLPASVISSSCCTT